MSKAHEITEMWKEIKPQMGKMINLAHQIETNADKEYQRGLDDAWEAVRKIRDMSWKDQKEVFGTDYYADIIALPVSEAIEKIRQYEQEKEEQIHVGDEYCYAGINRCVITEITDSFYRILWDCGTSGVIEELTDMEPTGRHFPEIAGVLQKMKENNDNK